MLLRRWLLPLSLIVSFSPALAADAPPSIPKVWNGELMESDQGAVAIHSVIFDMDGKGATDGTFAFRLKGRKNGIVYSFQSPNQSPKAPPETIWKIKDDTYDLMEVSSVNSRGRKLTWKGPYKLAFTVKAKALSILGEWYLVHTKGGNELRVLVKPQPNRSPLENLRKTFVSVIDGLDGHVLEQFGAKTGAEPGQIRTVLRSQRSILMTYKVDLFRDNKVASSLAAVLSANDADIRSCYTDLLEIEAAPAGTLAYTFVYSGEMQSIKALKIKNSGLKNPRFLECMHYKLLGLTFPLAKSMIGELTFQFQVK